MTWKLFYNKNQQKCKHYGTPKYLKKYKQYVIVFDLHRKKNESAQFSQKIIECEYSWTKFPIRFVGNMINLFEDNMTKKDQPDEFIVPPYLSEETKPRITLEVSPVS